MDEERRGHDIAKEAQIGDDRAEAPALRNDVQEFDLEQVSGAGAFDIERPRQRMNRPEREGGQVGRGGVRGQVAVDGIPGLQRDLFALPHLGNGLDIGMPAVVSRLRFVTQVSASIDLDGRHCSFPFLPSSESGFTEGSRRGQDHLTGSCPRPSRAYGISSFAFFLMWSMMSFRIRSRGTAVRISTSSFGTISQTIGGACSVISVAGYCHIVVSRRICRSSES